MEEWLQTEWSELRVYVANLTEQFAQVAVVGPKARAVLEALGGDIDLSPRGAAVHALGRGHARRHPGAGLSHLLLRRALLRGRGAGRRRARRSGTRCGAAGAAFGIAPYGTEALHVMRAEKGFIMIGDETDGTVTPQDLGLGWAVSKKKPDFIGKRAQARPDLTRPDRKQLVGLAHRGPGGGAAGRRPRRRRGGAAAGATPTLGHVTSSYFSPTLGRSIAMALIEGGAGRMGEMLSFPVGRGRPSARVVVDPVFLDKEGARQDV